MQAAIANTTQRSDPMSLKAFHILFGSVCVVFCVGFGVWAVFEYRDRGEVSSLVWGVLSLLAAVGLVWYGLWFLKKLKGVSNL